MQSMGLTCGASPGSIPSMAAASRQAEATVLLMYVVPCGFTLHTSVCYTHGCSLWVLCSSGGLRLIFFIHPFMSSWLLWLTLRRGKGLFPMCRATLKHPVQVGKHLKDLIGFFSAAVIKYPTGQAEGERGLLMAGKSWLQAGRSWLWAGRS